MATTQDQTDPNYDPTKDPNSPLYAGGYSTMPVATPALDPSQTPYVGTPSQAQPNTFLGQPALPVGNVTGGGYMWSGAAPQSDADYNAMIAAADTARGGQMSDPSAAYWEGVAPAFQARYGSGWANELYQRMLGKEAGGADAALAGPYSAAQGYVYTPDQSGVPTMATTPTSVTSSATVPTGVSDTSWMNTSPPGPGWVAVPGVGWVPPDSPAAQGYTSQQNSSSASSQPTTAQQVQDAYQQAILGLLQTPQTVDAQALQSNPAVAAYRLSQQRSADQQRAQAVESAIQGGTYSSSPDVTSQLTRGIDQQAAENTAGFTGQVALSQMQQNREALIAGIQAAQSAGQFDKAQALQLQLAQMQQAIQQAEIAQQGTIAQGQLGLGQAQLAQNLQEFLDSLGYNYASLGANLNQAATLALLNGAG